MRGLTCWSLAISVCLVAFLATLVESRQYCWSCQFQTGGRGKECLDSPQNLTKAAHRIRCPDLCMTNARFNADGEPTFILRSCGYKDSYRKDGCNKISGIDICIFTCEGENYCNDKPLATSPLKDPNAATSSRTVGWIRFVLEISTAVLVACFIPGSILV